MTVNEERIREKLKEALCNVYNTEINFANEVSVKGLIGLTLDKQSILMLEISETFSKNSTEDLSEDGGIQTSHKSLLSKDTSKRQAFHNLNDLNCKRQKICERPSILSALTEVDTYHDNNPIQNGIAHKHQVNSGFTTIPVLADHVSQGNLNNQENENGLEEPLKVKDEPDDDGDIKMEDEQVVREVKNEKENDVVSPRPASPLHGEDNINQLTGMNMFTNMFDASNPVYSPYQGVHHRYQMDNESPASTKKLYFCDQCNYSTTWPSNLKRHKQKHSEPESRPMIAHECEKCEYKTGWSSNLKRHLRTVHGENQERVYECPSCMTIQVSKGETVVCKSCRATFNSSQVMKQHVQNVIRQEMTSSDPGLVSNGLKTENKTLDDSEKACMLPGLDPSLGLKRGHYEALGSSNYVETFSVSKEPKTTHAQKQGDDFSKNVVTPQRKILQESPVIDKGVDMYRFDVNGNGDFICPGRVDEASVIAPASGGLSPRMRSQSSEHSHVT